MSGWKLVSTVIKLRRDTLANWELNNPVLAEGEVGLVIDVNGNVKSDTVTVTGTYTATLDNVSAKYVC